MHDELGAEKEADDDAPKHVFVQATFEGLVGWDWLACGAGPSLWAIPKVGAWPSLQYPSQGHASQSVHAPIRDWVFPRALFGPMVLSSLRFASSTDASNRNSHMEAVTPTIISYFCCPRCCEI